MILVVVKIAISKKCCKLRINNEIKEKVIVSITMILEERTDAL